MLKKITGKQFVLTLEDQAKIGDYSKQLENITDSLKTTYQGEPWLSQVMPKLKSFKDRLKEIEEKKAPAGNLIYFPTWITKLQQDIKTRHLDHYLNQAAKDLRTTPHNAQWDKNIKTHKTNLQYLLNIETPCDIAEFDKNEQTILKLLNDIEQFKRGEVAPFQAEQYAKLMKEEQNLSEALDSKGSDYFRAPSTPKQPEATVGCTRLAPPPKSAVAECWAGFMNCFSSSSKKPLLEAQLQTTDQQPNANYGTATPAMTRK